MTEPKRSRGGWWIWAAVVLLALLHQDIWLWDNRTLLFGVLPVGLGYHAMFSVVCAIVWALATKFAWPYHIEEWADETSAHADDEVSS